MLFRSVLAVPRGHALASRASLAPADLRALDLLLLEEGHCLRGHALGACGIADRPNPSGLAATSLPTLLQMVEAGLGITLLPGMAVRSNFFEASAVVARPLAPPSTLFLPLPSSCTT